MKLWDWLFQKRDTTEISEAEMQENDNFFAKFETEAIISQILSDIKHLLYVGYDKGYKGYENAPIGPRYEDKLPNPYSMHCAGILLAANDYLMDEMRFKGNELYYLNKVRSELVKYCVIHKESESIVENIFNQVQQGYQNYRIDIRNYYVKTRQSDRKNYEEWTIVKQLVSSLNLGEPREYLLPLLLAIRSGIAVSIPIFDDPKYHKKSKFLRQE